ncbi:MFS transporter [Burkholderia dolosa]|jgi:MFS family permease|uniref:MFS transporter n=1 Tax=Burkholderia dolosa TaxID=152500 RepID=A0A892IGK2_9BURK|nr:MULTISPECIES: MFS transporter [Burkholderia]AKE06021.1 MFS transporter [Burkholderia cepacia]AJY10333.1 major Facilitator Superfamily protein [Burkholderia dolosa AU0158]AYZ93646.1 MFS transporter [Burkholderia dolosa]EAY70631.1 Major facilitator superfamily (MFS_1) transporter [Burkholderia dolosa AU0158]ETP62632.1 MFS transporter [Burkholderia dolosa PC543]
MAILTDAATPAASVDETEERLYRKVLRRVLPLLLLCYVVAYLDRVNVGFAKLQMLDSLGLSDTVYAVGASIFFWGYFLFEIPSNLLLHRYGARFWIARIMVSWGIVSSSLAFIAPMSRFFHVEPSTMFYILRFLLGACEAGFFPGVILYMNYWFPARRQSTAMSGFLIAIPVSLTLGGIVSGWLMENTHGMLGLGGWQWMLLLEGIPSIVVAFIVLACLGDGIASAKWLSPAEKAVLQRNLDQEATKKTHSIAAAFRNPRVWLLTFILLTFNTGFYGLAFWLPSIIRASGVQSPLSIGLLTAIPYLSAVAAMIWNARHSRKTGERRLHAAIPAGIGGIGLMLSAFFASNVPLSILFLTISTCAILGLMPIYWTFPGQILSGTAAAAGIALINSIGNLSGFTGSMITNVAKNLTGNINNGTYALGACLLVSCALILAIPKDLLDSRADTRG